VVRQAAQGAAHARPRAELAVADGSLADRMPNQRPFSVAVRMELKVGFVLTARDPSAEWPLLALNGRSAMSEYRSLSGAKADLSEFWAKSAL
jgi:hypothetical protein